VLAISTDFVKRKKWRSLLRTKKKKGKGIQRSVNPEDYPSAGKKNKGRRNLFTNLPQGGGKKKEATVANVLGGRFIQQGGEEKGRGKKRNGAHPQFCGPGAPWLDFREKRQRV